MRNKVYGLNRKHKPSKSLKAPSEGIPSSKRTDDVVDP